MLQLGSELFDLLNAKQWVGNQEPVIYGAGGLSTLQIQLIEAKLGFRIPEDFAFLLQNVRDPGGVLFPWSDFKKQRYDDRLAWVVRGIEFSVEHDGFWLKRLGERPEALADALEKLRGDFKTWPKLLPIYGHRFLAAEPCDLGNPVFSIMGTDIIYYGANLAHYLVHEFLEQGPGTHNLHTVDQGIRRRDVWSDIVERDASTVSFDREKITAAFKAARNAFLRRRETNPLVQLELGANGYVSVDGHLFALGSAFEAKLEELAQRSPLPDLRLQLAEDSVSESTVKACQQQLSDMGYATILYLQRDSDKVAPVSGPVWHFRLL